MRPLLIVPLLLASLAVPTVAAGEPQCLMVYPWSELCQGDVEGFLRAMGIDVTVNCIAMSPWWELCNGNVPGVVAWVTDALPPVLP